MVALICHPTTRSDAVRGIQVQVRMTAPKTLALRYVLDGDLARLLIPVESAPQRVDKLWQHTCFEAFVGAMETAGYYEFNFSPSSEWAAYRFSAYREGMAALDAAQPPRVLVHRDIGSLTLEASIDLGRLRLPSDNSDLRLALSAVIEGADRNLSYWAVAHPAGKADFHHAVGFAVRLSDSNPPSPQPSPARGEGDLKRPSHQPSLARGEGKKRK
jgi:hypothetical protein